MSLLLRAPTTDDAPALARLHVSVWREAYADILAPEALAACDYDKRLAMWQRLTAAPANEDFRVATLAGQIVGFAGLSRTETAAPKTTSDAVRRTVELGSLYVAAQHWGQGIGQALWVDALARAVAQGYERLVLWVLIDNQRALRFYERRGLRRTGQQGEHAGATTICLELALSDQ